MLYFVLPSINLPHFVLTCVPQIHDSDTDTFWYWWEMTDIGIGIGDRYESSAGYWYRYQGIGGTLMAEYINIHFAQVH